MHLLVPDPLGSRFLSLPPLSLSALGWTELLWGPQFILNSSVGSSVACDSQGARTCVLSLHEAQGLPQLFPPALPGLGYRCPSSRVGTDRHSRPLPRVPDLWQDVGHPSQSFLLQYRPAGTATAVRSSCLALHLAAGHVTTGCNQIFICFGFFSTLNLY